VKSKLDSYKNKYITSIFENSQNAGGISSTIVSSLVYRDSATEYLNRTSQVQAVTPSQVLSAYEKYFSPLTKKDSSAVKWVVLTGKESLEKYQF
jgi:predicted Zn-dependent peptidase